MRVKVGLPSSFVLIDTSPFVSRGSIDVEGNLFPAQHLPVENITGVGLLVKRRHFADSVSGDGKRKEYWG